MRFAETTIKKYLYQPGAVFDIPEFQRPYTWKTENAQEYLKDLEESVTSGKGHYFGTVVQVEDEDGDDAYSIIDGQQRVTTSLLLIFAIYHLAKKNPALLGDSDMTPDDILENYLVNKNRKNNRIKLRTVTTDNEILQHIFESNGDVNDLDEKDKLSKLYNVYSVFSSYFSKKDNLAKYVNGLNFFKIVSITLQPEDDNPQRVFESINSTGEPLSDGDKIRNFALMLNSKDLREHVYEDYWRTIERKLTDVNKDHITDFFRYYLISKRQSNIKLQEVYTDFKKVFDRFVGHEQQREDIDSFYGEIKRALKFYELLKLADTNSIKNNPEFSEYSDIAENIFRMRYLRVDLYIPFGMSVLGYHADGQITDTELREIFNLIESYFSRRVIVNFYVTSVDRFMASLHKQVLDYLRRDREANYVEVFKHVLLSQTGQTQMPNDVDFENAVRTYPFYEQHGNSVLCYVLAATDDKNKEQKSTLHRIVEEGDFKPTVEHVMPQTLTRREWKDMLGEEYERIHNEYLHTLANLTLTGYNTEYSNLPYNGVPTKDKMTLEVKNKQTGNIDKVGFSASLLPINDWIKKQDVWNEDTLKQRQEWWLEKLNKIWPLPTTSFKPVEEDTTVFLLDDIDLKGKGVKSVEVFGKKETVANNWADALDTIVEAIYDNSPEQFMDAVNNDEWLSRYIKTDSSALVASREIYSTGYFVDVNSNTNAKRQLLEKLATALNLPQDSIKAELKDYTSGEPEDGVTSEIIDEAFVTTKDGAEHKIVMRESGQIQVFNVATGEQEMAQGVMNRYIDENGIGIDHKPLNTRQIGKKLLEHLRNS